MNYNEVNIKDKINKGYDGLLDSTSNTYTIPLKIIIHFFVLIKILKRKQILKCREATTWCFASGKGKVINEKIQVVLDVQLAKLALP